MTFGTASHIGNYRLAQQLGAGGMGIVYRAEDESLGREVAIKVLHPHLLKNKEHKERFRREARVHAKLMHPNIVTLLALHEEEHQMALVMEMVHGKNLKEYLQQEENYAIADLIKIALSVLAGLEAAHQIGLIHRDLKPANVLISDTGEVKLMDFGLAKSATGEDDLTQTGATVGSFRYMAPEQITNQTLDQRTDIYAFGILLYQMVTGHLPFDATAEEGGEFSIMEKQVRELPELPHEVNPAVPLTLSDLILRMMAKDPDERPENCDEVRQGLQAVLQNISAKASAPSFARLAESATKYFEFDMKANEDQWKKIKQSSILQKLQKSKTIILSVIGVLFLAWLTWLTLSDHDVIESVVDKPTHSVKAMAMVQPLAVVPIKPMPDITPAATPKDIKSTVPIAQNTGKIDAKKVDVSVKQVAKPKVVQKTPVVKATTSVKTPIKKLVKKVAPKLIEKDILDRVAYKVRRQYGKKIDMLQAHEFHGGSHLYFKNLAVTKEKTFFTQFKKNDVRLYFYEAVHLKAIVLEQATVQGALFKGGKIKLEVQDEHFKWHTLIKRSDHDVSTPIRISEKSLPASVKSVRIRLTSSSPLLLGPIRLLE
ncbi:MAG: serine/threonine-protein kinase [Mariprofundaceae bacterium]|nr:serine/threonine-protein kinase [Mariprofundaceae bacterium]